MRGVDFQKSVQTMIAEQLSDLDMGITTSFYRTSIYDNSIFDGVSKCVQRILPRRTNVQNLLNSLSQSCGMSKVYLFDTFSKLCIAMDSTPNESSLYELCSDSIDVVLELVGIYSRSDGAATTALTSSDSLKLEDEVGRELKEPTVASIM